MSFYYYTVFGVATIRGTDYGRSSDKEAVIFIITCFMLEKILNSVLKFLTKLPITKNSSFNFQCCFLINSYFPTRFKLIPMVLLNINSFEIH